MSGDWIKMRTDLPTNPKVIRMSVALGAHVSAVCGACFVLWSVADSHAVGGRLPGYTFAVIDGMVGIPGFAEAASHKDVGWLRLDAQGVFLPKFGVHNGNTAKTRATTAKRAARFRAASENPSRSRNGDIVTNCAPTAEQSRAEQTESRAAKSRIALTAADGEQSRAELCPLLLSIRHNGGPVFDAAAAAAIAANPRVTPMLVAWAVERMNERFRRKGGVENPGGYLRTLIEHETPTPGFQRRWREQQVAKVAAMASGTKAGVA